MKWLFLYVFVVILVVWRTSVTYRSASPGDYVIITVYNPEKSQTNSSPLITADGSVIDPDNLPPWIAVSRDLLADYPMGTAVRITCDCPYDGEIREVRDKMNARFTKRIDVLTHNRTGIYGGAIKRR